MQPIQDDPFFYPNPNPIVPTRLPSLFMRRYAFTCIFVNLLGRTWEPVVLDFDDYFVGKRLGTFISSNVCPLMGWLLILHFLANACCNPSCRSLAHSTLRNLHLFFFFFFFLGIFFQILPFQRLFFGFRLPQSLSLGNFSGSSLLL